MPKRRVETRSAAAPPGHRGGGDDGLLTDHSLRPLQRRSRRVSTRASRRTQRQAADVVGAPRSLPTAKLKRVLKLEDWPADYEAMPTEPIIIIVDALFYFRLW